MKKGSLNFLNRKSQSLFDTNVQMRDLDNVELVLDSAVLPESGTAKVRSRPTVKHFSTSGDGALGFAVPTPKVPVLPPISTPQLRHTGSADGLPNGKMMSVDDPEEGEIFIPPPPSVAPPPPPPQFIPPSPQYIPPPLEFFGELDRPVDLSTLQPPSMPPPKPPSLTTSSEELNLVALQPPPMAPPKPPSDVSNPKASVPISGPTDPVQDIPECPKFTPPLPPVEKPQSPLLRGQKTAPPKPARLSSMYSFEMPPTGTGVPTPTPPATPASSFKPQTTAKLYNVPKTTLLSSQTEREQKTQHILLLEDSSGNPVGVHINGKTPTSVKEVSPSQTPVPPAKPTRRNSSGIQLEEDLQELKGNVQEIPTNRPTTPNRTINGEPVKVVTVQEAPTKTQPPTQTSPVAQTSLPLPSASDRAQVRDQPPSPRETKSYSPLLNRKLQTLRGHEGSGGKETAASPLALLMAAKQREKQRVAFTRQSSNKSSSSTDSLNMSVQPSEIRPNSFVVTPRPVSISESLNTEPVPAAPTGSQPNTQSIKPSYRSPKLSQAPHSAPSISTLGPVKQKANASPSGSQPSLMEDSISFIPPPPEFANSDSEDEGPPSTPPPDPPVKSVALSNGPPTLLKPKPPSTAPPLSSSAEKKMPVQLKTQPLASSSAQLKTQHLNPVPAPPNTLPPAPPKTQPPAPPNTLPPAPPKTQPLASPKTQPPAPPNTLPPAPPKTQPPAPPKTQPLASPKTQPLASPNTLPPAPPKTQPPAPPKTQPPAPPKTQPPAPPKNQPLVPQKTQPPVPPPVQPKKQLETTPTPHLKTQLPAPTPQQATPSVSANQATLLSILQKKMLEMDPKFAPVREADSSGEDWNSPLSDDDGATSPPPKPFLKVKSPSQPTQAPTLDMKELESKVAQKAQSLAAKAPVSNGPHTKQQYGMTFTIRPGTKQPITPVTKTE